MDLWMEKKRVYRALYPLERARLRKEKLGLPKTSQYYALRIPAVLFIDPAPFRPICR